MIKRISFAHERELMALIQDNASMMKKDPDGKVWIHDYSAKNDKLGILVPANPSDLIEAVYVAPMSPPWFKVRKDIVKISSWQQYCCCFRT